MSRFQFRLEKLRRLREITRDAQRGRLADAYRARQVLEQQHAALGVDLQEARAYQRQLATGGPMDVDRLTEAQRYQLVLQSRANQLAEQVATLETEIEKRRVALVEADRQVRLLDRLEERQRAEHRRREDAAEIKRLDETAAQRQHGIDS